MLLIDATRPILVDLTGNETQDSWVPRQMGWCSSRSDDAMVQFRVGGRFTDETPLREIRDRVRLQVVVPALVPVPGTPFLVDGRQPAWILRLPINTHPDDVCALPSISARTPIYRADGTEAGKLRFDPAAGTISSVRLDDGDDSGAIAEAIRQKLVELHAVRIIDAFGIYDGIHDGDYFVRSPTRRTAYEYRGEILKASDGHNRYLAGLHRTEEGALVGYVRLLPTWTLHYWLKAGLDRAASDGGLLLRAVFAGGGGRVHEAIAEHADEPWAIRALAAMAAAEATS